MYVYVYTQHNIPLSYKCSTIEEVEARHWNT